jgi:chromosome segregation ATPase
MSLLKRLFEPHDTEETEERLERLEKKMLDNQSEWRRLQEEWTDVYGKFRRLHMRVAKQIERLPDDESSQEEPQPEGEDGIIAGPSSLSPRLRKIQQEILARRQRAGVPMKGGE